MKHTEDINNPTKDIIFVNYILDNVHGFIGLTYMEDKIERLPIFKRLQDISQLGLVKRIFPGALHNRYIHSLGVMYVIDQMALHLKHFNTAERQLLRLAGMLHDLGHYPLSHDLEQVYDQFDTSGNMPIESMEKVFVGDVKLELKKIREQAEGKPRNPTRELVVKDTYHHETMTAFVIRQSCAIKEIITNGLKQGFFDDETRKLSIKNDEEIEEFSKRIICDICALIQGNSDHQYNSEGAFPEHFTAMLQMLHSELDADRIDYLLRDATFSGASYGEFDVGLLLQNLVMKEVTKGETTFWVVGIREKGIGCADQYMINRYLAYTQVIFNKYTSIIGKMVREVVRWMIDGSSGLGFYNRNEVMEHIKNHEKNKMYLGFTDSYFFEKLNLIRKEDNGCPDDIYYFVEKLKDYSALDVESENIFSGEVKQMYEHIINSDIYQKNKDIFEGENKENEYNSLYLLSHKKITNHVPFEIFKSDYEKNNKNHGQSVPFVQYEIDRLMDGLAVIKDDGTVSLLIDSPRSIMGEMYKVQQIILREYKISETD